MSTNNDRLADLLADLLATETRSLVGHVMATARPYLTPKTYPIWKRLQTVAAQSRAHAQRLSDLISDLDLPPRTVPFRPDVSYYHDVTMQTLLPQVIRGKLRQIAMYEQAIEHAADHPEAQAMLKELLAENNQQLEQLRADLKSLTSA